MDASRRALVHAGLAGSGRTLRSSALVQARADDVVLAAGLFKPNAAGSHELTNGGGFGQRQLLKARGAYLAERVVLGVTPLHVHALAVFFGGRVARAAGCWPRSDLIAVAVDAIGDRVDPVWPALLLAGRHGREIAELQVLRRDESAWSVLALLLRANATSDR
jgi:hypothetical protein